ncbi:hypothetical protein HMPREF0663_10855 [Hoylesella oralis ATCC 33269]|uniref:Transposase DDE domain-containing protein n=1 Tax=Hoylesella oralis ATCC 33269 TaxID=873533 RepID=E7RNV4_9BACT|nr:hypothetical protein HMPREF0663_10855 [Hoylesella oralis ATCC 33269]
MFERPFVDGIQFLIKLKKNMKEAVSTVAGQILIRKRAIIEAINDELKNIAQVEHSKHRPFDNFIVNMFRTIAAYCYFSPRSHVLIWKEQRTHNLPYSRFVELMLS